MGGAADWGRWRRRRRRAFIQSEEVGWGATRVKDRHVALLLLLLLAMWSDARDLKTVADIMRVRFAAVR